MRYALVCVGTSWGGLSALRTMLHGLGADFPLPIAIVQHRHRDSNHILADLLQDCTPLAVSEVEDKQPLHRGHVFVAPPNYHLLIDGDHFSLTTDAPVRFSRPSIDVTFATAADALGARAVGLILTGANTDGSHGLKCIADAGGLAIVQDPATSESPIMPQAALRAVPEAVCLPLDAIAPHLIKVAVGERTIASRPARVPPARDRPAPDEPTPETP